MKKKKEFPINMEIYKYESGFIQIYFNLDCNDLIDWHEYHDAPFSVTWYLEKEELMQLKNLIEIAVQKYNELENKSG